MILLYSYTRFLPTYSLNPGSSRSRRSDGSIMIAPLGLSMYVCIADLIKSMLYVVYEIGNGDTLVYCSCLTRSSATQLRVFNRTKYWLLNKFGVNVQGPSKPELARWHLIRPTSIFIYIWNGALYEGHVRLPSESMSPG